MHLKGSHAINLSRHFILLLCVFAGAKPSDCYAADSLHHQKPNIILIYIDDLGYADLGNYGKAFGQSLIETPNIDRLRTQGMKFTNAYAAAPLCSPSRAAMLTGKSPARLGFEFVTRYPEEKYAWDDQLWRDKFKDLKLVPPPFTLNLPLEEITIAEMLKQQNYTTGIAGKWHVSSHYKQYNGWNPEFGPAKQGFDWTADTFGAWKSGSKEKITKEGGFPQDELTSKAVSFIKTRHDQPFFLFVSHYYVHLPLDDRIQWLIDKYKKRAVSGESEQRIIYAAFVETMDHYVGQLLDAIDESGLTKNTIVLLTSDNGGMPEMAYNRPFRGSKWNLYEGGLRVPMIVRWPGIVKQGSVCQAPVIQTDLLSTFYEIAGGKKGIKMSADGMSFLPLLKGINDPAFAGRSLVWHFPYYHPESLQYAKAGDSIGVEDGYISKTTPQSSIRKGRLKYIYFYESGRGELYDLQNDPAEHTDLSVLRPEEAKEMKLALLAYLTRVKARLPQKNL